MEYVILLTQSHENYYCAIVKNKFMINHEPTQFYENKNDAILDLYTIKCRDIDMIKRLYHTIWKSKNIGNWKKFKKSWYKDTKYTIEEVD